MRRDKENIIQQKSFDFALKIVDLYKVLVHQKKEFVMSKQLLRSGTSVGANVEEAIGAQSKADFIHKLSISYKEARETSFWIKLLNKSSYIDDQVYKELKQDCDEVLRILTSILNTLKGNNR
ncbi:MAG: four helix bundle protein [Bacteroidota bacterium]